MINLATIRTLNRTCIIQSLFKNKGLSTKQFQTSNKSMTKNINLIQLLNINKFYFTNSNTTTNTDSTSKSKPVEKTKFVTQEEFKNNDGKDGRKLFILIKGKIYDVTNFDHPGGREVHERDRLTDKEISFFIEEGHNQLTTEDLDKYYFGLLKM